MALIDRRSFLGLATGVAMAGPLVGCGRTESYRYKLVLAVNTPDGIKQASSVVEVVFWGVVIPERGIMHKVRGEALYLELGPRQRPLIALLTGRFHQPSGAGMNNAEFIRAIRWTDDWGPSLSLLSDLYGPMYRSPKADLMDDVQRIAVMKGAHKITPADLPDLVSLDDKSDPKSLFAVDANDLQATLGPNISWREITLEMTDEPVTTGIRARLPWLPADHDGVLDGTRYDNGATLASRLRTTEFESVW